MFWPFLTLLTHSSLSLRFSRSAKFYLTRQECPSLLRLDASRKVDTPFQAIQFPTWSTKKNHFSWTTLGFQACIIHLPFIHYKMRHFIKMGERTCRERALWGNFAVYTPIVDDYKYNYVYIYMIYVYIYVYIIGIGIKRDTVGLRFNWRDFFHESICWGEAQQSSRFFETSTVLKSSPMATTRWISLVFRKAAEVNGLLGRFLGSSHTSKPKVFGSL